jgi:spectinomycin phosphotransferase
MLATMRTAPHDLTDADVGAAVAARWPIVAKTVSYLPVGFGSHHWLVVEPTGRRWFVTADAVADSEPRLAELTAALTTAHALRHRCGLGFVVAPCTGLDGALLAVSGRYAVAVYPYLEPSTAAAAGSEQTLAMVTALHGTTADVVDLAHLDDLSIRDRSALEAVLVSRDAFLGSGPFAADFAHLVAQYQTPIREALGGHDAVAATIGAELRSWVITHGEPKPNNTMITASGPVLVDWDTVRLAPPARDLWMTGSVHEYTALTGREVPAHQLGFYRLRRDLQDLCVSAAWFAAPHRRTSDTELAWQGSLAICHRLATLAGKHQPAGVRQ